MFNPQNNISQLTSAEVAFVATVSSASYNVKLFGAKGDGVTDDSGAVAAAQAAMTSGGRLYFPAGTYLFNSSVQIYRSGTLIEGESLGSTTILVNYTNSDALYGAFAIWAATSAGSLRSVAIRNLSINLNSKGTAAVSVRCRSNPAPYENISLEDVEIYGNGIDAGGSRGAVTLQSSQGAITGAIRNFVMNRVLIRDGAATTSSADYAYSVRVVGDYVDGFSITNCRFYNTYDTTICVTTPTFRSQSNWNISGNEFKKTIQNWYARTLADFNDDNVSGFTNITFAGNYFDQSGNSWISTNDVFCLCVYHSEGLTITGNHFYKCRSVYAPGRTVSGGDENIVWTFSNNTVDQCIQFVDPDGQRAGTFDNNVFSSVVQGPVIFGYGLQYPLQITNNVFYNCVTSPSTATEQAQSLILVEEGGVVIDGNAIYDDLGAASKLKYVFSELHTTGSATYPVHYVNNRVLGGANVVRTFYLESELAHVIVGNTGIVEALVQNSVTHNSPSVTSLASTDVAFGNFQAGGNAVTNDAKFGGKVGVGTSTPKNLLDVRNTSGQQLRLGDTAGDQYSYVVGRDPSSSLLKFEAQQNNFGGYSFSSSVGGVTTEKLRIDTTGNVGIGQAAPSALLDVSGATTSAASLRIRSGTAPTSPNDGDVWYDGTNLKIRIGGATKTFTVT